MRRRSLAPAVALGLLASGPTRAEEGDARPPRTDYCEMLVRDIQGEHYGFLAGNKLYYVSGSFGAYWHEFWESETIGFTHPLFRDGRARGHGIATADLYYYQDNNRRKLILKYRPGDQAVRKHVPAADWSTDAGELRRRVRLAPQRTPNHGVTEARRRSRTTSISR